MAIKIQIPVFWIVMPASDVVQEDFAATTFRAKWARKWTKIQDTNY